MWKKDCEAYFRVELVYVDRKREKKSFLSLNWQDKFFFYFYTTPFSSCDNFSQFSIEK